MNATIQIVLVIVAIAAAIAAAHRFHHRHRHPRFIHHSLGYTLVAILAIAALLLYGPE